MNQDDVLQFCSEAMTELTTMVSKEFSAHETTFVTANAVALERVAAQAAASSVAAWLAIRASIRQGGN